MIKISAIAHASFETPDLERMSEYYQQVLGLALVDRADNAVYLACPLDYHSVVLKAGPAARCTGITLRTPPDLDFKDTARFLSANNVKAQLATDSEPCVGERLSFGGPD